jgi:hypothetical protein
MDSPGFCGGVKYCAANTNSRASGNACRDYPRLSVTYFYILHPVVYGTGAVDTRKVD